MRHATSALATLLAVPLAHANLLRRDGKKSDDSNNNNNNNNNHSSQTIPAAVNIAAAQNWDGNDGPWSSFPLQVGTQPQTVRVMVGTSASSIFTINSDGCPSYYPSNCEQLRGGFFNINQSSTWVPNSKYNVGIGQSLGMDTQGTAGYDKAVIGWPGATQATADHNVIFNLESTVYWLGLFGLNPRPTNFTTSASITQFNNGQTSFMQALVDNNTIPSLSWGYTAGNQYRLNGNNLGSLTLGGYDAGRFNPTQNLSLPFGSDISRDLLVNLRAITTDGGSPSNLLPDGNIQVFLDSSVAQLWLPESACKAFEEAFGLSWDAETSFYLVNNTLHNQLTALNPNVTFTLASAASGGQTMNIVFPYAAFDLTLKFPNVANTTRYFPLKRANESEQYTLGRTFFQEAYIIADYDRQNFTVAPCEWDASRIAQQSIKSILRANATSSDSGSSSNTGAIAGGVVGGVIALVAIAGLVLFFFRRKKKAERQRLAELDAKSTADGAAGAPIDGKASSTDLEAKPFVAPMGGELQGSEIHQLDSPHKIDPNQAGYSEMENPREFYSPCKGVPAEMRGQTPIYEMPGSDVGELPAPRVNMTESK